MDAPASLQDANSPPPPLSVSGGQSVTPTPPSSSTSDFGGVLSDRGSLAILADNNRKMGEFHRELHGIDKDELTGRERIEGERDANVRPTFNAPAQPQSQSTRPEQVWASQAMLLGLLASALTRTPLTTAMNSAASVFKAYHQGDVDTYNAAVQKYKVDNDNAMKLYDMQTKSYEDIMSKLDRRENLNRQEAEDLRREVHAEMTAQASSVGHEIMLQALNQRGLQGAQQITMAQRKLLDQEKINQGKLDEAIFQHGALLKFQSRPDIKALIAKGDMISVYQKARDEGLIGKEQDPLQDESKRQAIISKLESTPEGKSYSNAQDANATIQALGRTPDILRNPGAQITLMDRYLFLATGSVRPGIAQYQKIIGAKTLRDYYEVKSGLLPYHPILGPDQVRNMLESAQVEADAASSQYRTMLARPEHRKIAMELGILPGEASTGKPPAEAITMLKHDRSPNAIKNFDEAFWPGAAGEALSGH